MPRGLLLRAARAAGLACDVQGIDRADVVLGSSRSLSAGRGTDGARLVMDPGLVASTPAGDLLELASEALRNASRLKRTPRGKNKDSHRKRDTRVILFENLFRDPERPGDDPGDIAAGSFLLASALMKEGIEVALVPGKLDPRKGIDDGRPLARALSRPGAAIVGITVLEACLEAVRALVERIRTHRAARIVLGGPMVTLAPEHAAVHLDGALVLVRGPGEGILPVMARLLAGRITEAAVESILGMDGVLYVGSDLLVAGHPGRVGRRDPDGSHMEFGLLEKRHLSRGLSLETGRGCTNPCVFCTTPGRGSHEGRSPAVVAGHLAAYRARVERLFGSTPPRSALRVHLCDDDFTCDPVRAAALLDEVAATDLRLSSFQASARDFDARRDPGGRLLDSIRPSLFQDADRFASLALEQPRGLPPPDVSCFVQIGFEALNDADLGRLGKGYTTAQACALVDALDERLIPHDAYLILSGPGTSIRDLAETLLVAARLKIEHPHTFFLRFPVVPFVVHTFPTAGYRRWRRRAEVARILSVGGYPEYDYPLVVRSVPEDPDVLAACEAWQEIIEPDACYLAPVENLEAWLRRRLPSVEEPDRSARLRRTIRALSGARRRIVYGGIGRARRSEIPERVGRRYWEAAGRLGPADEVAAEARRAIEVGDPRLVVIPTRDCSLRCAYCPMDKEQGRLMSVETLTKSVELLLSGSADDLILQFFGGEALLVREFVLGSMERALEMAAAAGKRLGFILSTNGVSLDPDLIRRLAGLPVKIEVSIDGPPEVHNRHRRPRDPGVDSYASATRCASALAASSIPHDVIMVVTPSTVDRLSESFAHVASLGFRRIQVNHALSVSWSREHKERFARELSSIEDRFYADGPGSGGAELIDLRTFTRPMLLNCEITVDHDGTIYYGNGFLVRTADAASLRAGHVDDLENLDTYLARRPGNDFLVERTYPGEVARNNLEVGRIYASFVAHMRRRFPDLSAAGPVSSPGPGHPR